MKRVPLLDGWTVGPKLGAFEALAGGVDRMPVRLPHDAQRDLDRRADSDQGVHAGYYPGGVFEYTRELDVPASWADKVVLLEFEGVYRDAAVFVDGAFAAHEAGGYNAFTVSLDPYLRPGGGTHRLSVEARAHKDSRWYTGAGIVRPVHLVVADPVHLPLDATVVTTPDVDAERAIVAVATDVANLTRRTASLRVRWTVTDPEGVEVATGSSPVTVLPGERATARVRMRVPAPRRWSEDAPDLYTVRAALETSDGIATDEDTVRFGIRTLQLDPEHGLRVNGETVKLRGACIHADNGPLGSVAEPAAEDRRIRLLKAAGFNAVRSSHHPISRALLEACDRHGVFVMDELTDVWTRAKTAFDASLTFPERWRADIDAMVRKDRNHPSVVLYSIGNEILELATPLGATWSRRLAEGVRAADPTRFVTNGINGIIANLDRMAEAQEQATAADPNTMMADMGAQMALMNASDLVTASTEESAAVLDVVGFNYAPSRYALDRELFPDRVIVGSETFPDQIDTMWELVERFPHVIGDFTWTGWDYIGEAGIGRVDVTDEPGYEPTGTAGPFPYLLAACGDIDITGQRRAPSYYREIVFGRRRDPWIAVHRPELHGRPLAKTPWSWDEVVGSWSWDAADGAPVTVDVYADADEVELLLDGASLGTEPVGVHQRFRARFEATYRPGILEAVARRGGEVIGRTRLRSASGPLALRIAAEDAVPGLGGAELAFVAVEIADAAGTVPCDRDVPVTVTVAGPAELAGLGSGRARTEERFDADTVTTYDGRALAVIRRTGPGPVEVRVSASGFAPVSAPLD